MENITAKQHSTAEDAQETVDLLNGESEAYMDTDIQLALEKAREAERIARSISSGEGYAYRIVWGMVNQARAHIVLSNYGNALELASRAKAWPIETPEMIDCHRMAIYAAGRAYEELGDLPICANTPITPSPDHTPHRFTRPHRLNGWLINQKHSVV